MRWSLVTLLCGNRCNDDLVLGSLSKSVVSVQGSLSGRISGNVQAQQVAGTLLSALTDQDTGVAAEASSTLTRSAAEPDGAFYYEPCSRGLYDIVDDK